MFFRNSQLFCIIILMQKELRVCPVRENWQIEIKFLVFHIKNEILKWLANGHSSTSLMRNILPKIKISWLPRQVSKFWCIIHSCQKSSRYFTGPNIEAKYNSTYIQSENLSYEVPKNVSTRILKKINYLLYWPEKISSQRVLRFLVVRIKYFPHANDFSIDGCRLMTAKFWIKTIRFLFPSNSFCVLRWPPSYA